MTGLSVGMVRSMTEGCLVRLGEENNEGRRRCMSMTHLNFAAEDGNKDDDMPTLEEEESLFIEEEEDEDNEVERLEEVLASQKWEDLKKLLQMSPQLAKEPTVFICQGEKVTSSVLHRAVASHDAPCVTLDAVQAIVTAHPSSLWETDGHGRLPLHVALLKNAGPSIINFLMQGTRTVREPDDEENRAIQYAILYGSPDVALKVCRAWPKALQLPNKRRRLPLHVLASVWSDLPDDAQSQSTWMDVLEDMLERYPQAAWAADPQGRLPLHLVCEHVLVQVNVLEKLINLHPGSLMVRDDQSRRPLDCLRHHKTESVVVQYVEERTRRQHRGGKLFARWRRKAGEQPCHG